MDTQKSDLMVALENFWNGFASARKDIVLIVCASATSWMLSKVVHNKGGLYNRLTEQIHLRTFCLRECEAYVKAAGLALNRNQILQYYMIFWRSTLLLGIFEKGIKPFTEILIVYCLKRMRPCAMNLSIYMLLYSKTGELCKNNRSSWD